VRLLMVVIALGLTARIAVAIFLGPSLEPLPGVADQASYHGLAVRVLDGHGFSFATGWWPATRANEPTAHWSYLYVLFLSAVYSVFGEAPLMARLVQVVIVGILHPLLAWRIGRRLFGPSVGLASAAATSAYGYFVFYAGALVTESLFFVAMLWALDVATALADPRDAGRARRFAPWAVLGLTFAVGALLRQAFLVMVPVIVVWIAWRLFWRRDGMGFFPVVARMAVTGAVLTACILPWTVRNYRAFDTFVLLNTNAGFVFFWGNHPFHGTQFVPILPSDPTQTNYGTLLPSDLDHLNEAELDRALMSRGLGFIADDPWRYTLLSISRAKEYFKFWPSPESGTTSNIVRVASFGLALPLLLIGLFVSFVGRGADDQPWAEGAGLLLWVAGVYSLVHLMTWTLVRYRLPVDAVTMPFVGVAIVALCQKMSINLAVPGTSLRNPAS
jgi:hypothetical protein